MAFDLRTNNASGFAVIDQPAGVLATQENFISQYDYVSVSTRIGCSITLPTWSW
jgi:hypothetical protein